MNYLGICLEYLRSVECKKSPLGVLSGALTLPFLFSFFVLLIRLFYIFLGVHVSVPGGADSRLLRREPILNFITEDFFAFNI